MDITALQLASRFSLATNSLGYCGQDSAGRKFKRCIVEGLCEGVEGEIGKFIVLYPYLKTIAVLTGLPVFSYPVIESYWLGNDLLKKAKLKHYDLLLENFAKQGVPDWLIGELKQKSPKVFIPTHLFQVLYVGVGRASGAVPFNLDSINNCMIRWGKVKKMNGQRVRLNLHSLRKVGQVYQLTTNQEVVLFDRRLVQELKIGHQVAVHWGRVFKILTASEEKNLSFWTKEVLLSLP